jgi:hypothetical protein
VEPDLGVVTKIERDTGEDGRTILRAIVEFYDGAAPDLTFKTVWQMTPVRITEARPSKAGAGMTEKRGLK